MASFKDRLAKVIEDKKRKKIIVPAHLSSYGVQKVVKEVPKWWLKGFAQLGPNFKVASGFDDIITWITTTTTRRVTWAYIMGSAECGGDPQSSVALGSLHTWAAWPTRQADQHTPTAPQCLRKLFRFKVVGVEQVVFEDKVLVFLDNYLAKFGKKKIPATIFADGRACLTAMGTTFQWVAPQGEYGTAWKALVPAVHWNPGSCTISSTEDQLEENAQPLGIIGTKHVPHSSLIHTIIRIMEALVVQYPDFSGSRYAAICAGTLPSIVNGVGPNSSAKVRKHIGNIGQMFGSSDPADFMGAWEGAKKAWDCLQGLLMPKNAALSLHQALLVDFHKTDNVWMKVLAQRMKGYGVTPLCIILDAVSMFPKAPWSLFFSRNTFDAPTPVSLADMGIDKPYKKYLALLQVASEMHIINGKELRDEPTEELLEQLLIETMAALVPSESDCPILKSQGDAFVEDLFRWTEQPFIMYTGIEGKASSYPDLSYFAVKLTKALCPGSQISGYLGAQFSRCKEGALMDQVVKRFIAVQTALQTEARGYDPTMGKSLVAAFNSAVAVSDDLIRELSDGVKGMLNPRVPDGSSSAGAEGTSE